ncbi:MerR family transcriptional regulator [Massilia arenosa]|uniref:MerR family transcriptional regulator n=2 Tax=Zemynaea arenosa TaxID=2561931 RepID=A0A4Y9S9L9_9BURK|nr:MerR family transcriptional regulator [Massilia arenosa]
MKDMDQLTISDVERECAIAKETLRVWERRYDFPKPQRDPHGERIYSREDVERLRLVKRLLDHGYRPGKIMHHPTSELAEMAAKFAPAAPPPPENLAELIGFIELLKAHRIPELRQRLGHAVEARGLRAFVLDVAAPLARMVGDAWEAGDIAVFEEHLFAEALESVLHAAIAAAAARAAHAAPSPRVLLTTVPVERHGIGLLMAEALLVLEGAHVLSLGVQTPLAEIVAAVRSQRADVVGLSFSLSTSVRATVENVTELRQRLGDAVEVWAGGASAAAARRHLAGVHVVGLDDIAGCVAIWRARHQAAG